MEFRRITNLPPYVFTIINGLKLEARQAGADVIDLGFGNPDIPSPPIAVEKLAEAARNPRNHRYSLSRGLPRLREEVAKYYAANWGVELDPELEITNTIGSKEGFSHLMWVLLERGDAAILRWEPLKVELNLKGELRVSYKGEELLEEPLQTNFEASPGRVIIMGGNGGLNEIKHLDNLELSLEYLEEVEGDENHEVIVTHEAGTSYVEFGAVAYEHSNPNQEVTQGGDTVDANTPGTYRVTYDAEDTHGNASPTLTRVVQVVDGIAPQITLNGESTIHLDLNQAFEDPGATASDNYDTSVEVSASGNVNVAKAGNYQVIYVASDAAGVVGWWVNPQAPGIDACGMAIKLMELTLATRA